MAGRVTKMVERVIEGAGLTRAAFPVTPQSPIEQFFGANSDAGKFVTIEGAMSLPAVWAAIRVLADGIGTLPLETYQQKPGGGKIKAYREKTYSLLRERPNPEMTGVELWSLVVAHLNSWGDAFIGKRWLSADVVPDELWPIRPDRVRVTRENGVKKFYLRDSALGTEDPTPYTSADILHIKGISLDGFTGISPIGMMRQAIGHGLALEEYGNRFFSNGAIPKVILTHPDELGKDAGDRIKEDWNSKYRGTQNAHKVAILEEGMDIKQVSMPLDDAQFVEQNRFSVQQIARIFKLPVSAIGGETADSLTYKTIEGDDLRLAKHGFRPWTVKIEHALHNDPDITPRPSLFQEFDFDAFLRADSTARSNYYQKALDPQKGWMTPGEVRQEENLPPDPQFDKRPEPTPTPAPGQTPPPGDQPPEGSKP